MATGLSETRIGMFLAEDRSRRARLTLATKFGISRTADGKRFIDNSEAHMIQALDGSLKRLGVDHVDLYYVHRLDPRFPVEETVGALARQVEKGKIRAIGLSETSPDTLRRACAVHPIAAMQSEYSLWTRGPELGMLQTCAELGVAFVAFSPVARGALSGRVRDIDALPASDFRKSTPRFTGLNWTRNLARIDAFVELARSFRPRPLRTGAGLGVRAGAACAGDPRHALRREPRAQPARGREAVDRAGGRGARARPAGRLGGGRPLYRRAVE